MSNPYREVYDAIMKIMKADPFIAALVSFVPIEGVNMQGVARRELENPETLRIALVPLGGSLENISSSSSRATEQYALRSTSGLMSLEKVLDLKWYLLKAFWNNRDLNLDYVENAEVVNVSDESIVGTSSADSGEGPSVVWNVSLVIKVSFILNRTILPMA